jgi:hypothetical protein
VPVAGILIAMAIPIDSVEPIYGPSRSASSIRNSSAQCRRAPGEALILRRAGIYMPH